jgi:uncharacterized protein YjbI with pentapeptide repeats
VLRNGSFGTIDAIKANMARNFELDGARVAGTLNVSDASIGGSLFLREGAESNDVSLLGTQVGGQVDLTSAKVAGTLNMDTADIGQSLHMRSDQKHRAEFHEVNLLGAKVGGQVDLVGTKVSGTLVMDSADIGQDLLMRGGQEHRAEFNEVSLLGARVGGQVDLTGAKVSGTLNMDSADIGQSLRMRSDQKHRAEFNEVSLVGATVGGQVDLTGAKVAGTLNMETIDISQYLLMYSVSGEPMLSTEFDQPIELAFAKIGNSVNLTGAALSTLDLTGATIDGELTLARPLLSPQWRDGGRLVLRNTSVDAIGDTAEEDVWPAQLDLDGFVYRRLGGYYSGPNVDIATRGSEWFVDWLGRDQPYSPQPYEQLAKVLQEMGHAEEANEVLFAGRERARIRAWQDGHYLNWLGLWLLRVTIGYGYDYSRTLYCVLGFVVAGSVACIWSRYGPPYRWLAWHSAWTAGRRIRELRQLPRRLARKWRFVLLTLVYSLDHLLPIIDLSKHYDDIPLRVGARYYFCFHIIAGYVLASFLIAGLAGLTK